VANALVFELADQHPGSLCRSGRSVEECATQVQPCRLHWRRRLGAKDRAGKDERCTGFEQFSAQWGKRVLFGCSELPLLTRCRSAVRVCSPERSVTCEEAGRYDGKVGRFGSEAYARGNKNTGRAFDKLERMEPFVSRVTSAIVGCQGLAAGSTTFDPGRQTAISISEELHL
jgi:hypothetical protein